MKVDITFVMVLAMTCLHTYAAYSSFLNGALANTIKSKLSQVGLEGRRLFMQSDLENGEIAQLLRKAPIAPNQRVFLINGWRWHTLSVIHDLNRFKKVSQHFQAQVQVDSRDEKACHDRLQGCYKFVYGFNWKCLMKVEQEIFFPWLMKILPESVRIHVNSIGNIHKQVDTLALKLLQQCNSILINEPRRENAAQLNFLRDIDLTLDEMAQCAMKIQAIQETYLVPVVSAYVTAKDQDKFNKKVIAGLGLVNSQIHLVSMFEAVKESPAELATFKAQIPRIAQIAIPLWRSRLYNSKAKYLFAVS